MEIKFQARVISVGSVIKTKNNEAKSTYVTCTVEVLDGPAKGTTQFADRTLANADGAIKEPVTQGQEVTVYGDVVANRETGKPMLLFNIQAGANVTDMDDTIAMFGLTGADIEQPVAIKL